LEVLPPRNQSVAPENHFKFRQVERTAFDELKQARFVFGPAGLQRDRRAVAVPAFWRRER
jgi:hypothetical protein